MPTMTDILKAISMDDLPLESEGRFGAGVVVGLIDVEGLAYKLSQFQTEMRESRISAIWDMRSTVFDGENISGPTETTPYQGARFYKKEITKAIWDNSDLGLSLSDEYSHGTATTSIAAGNDGVAREADIVFVNVANSFREIVAPIPPERSEDPIERPPLPGSFGDLESLLDALRFIFNKAGNRPCVVNISLGTTDGPHDGTSKLELLIDEMVSEQSNRAVVISSANYRDNGNLFGEGRVRQGRSLDFTIKIKDTTEFI